jgi:ribosome-binding protein aMBF1 (putative translation factor)
MSARELAERIEALEAALHRIEDASYINQLQGTANFERLQSIARAALKGGSDEN